MRYLLYFLALAVCVDTYGADNVTTSRKLLAQLDGESDPDVRIRLYRDLSDLWYEQPQAHEYLKKLLDLCKASANQELITETLSDIAYAYIKSNQPDSARYYMHQLSQHPKTEALQTFLYIKLFDQRMNNSDNNVLAEESGFFKEQKKDKNSIYSRIHEAYTTGNSLYLLSRPAEALPHMQTAYELSLQLPIKQGYELQNLTEWTLARIHKNLGDRQKYVETIQHLLDLSRTYFASYYKNRPYFPVNVFELFYFSSLLSCIDLLPEQTVEQYISQIRGMTNLHSPYDKFNRAWALNEYYTSKNQHHESLAMIDSMTTYARIINSAYLPDLRRMKSQIYDRMGDYKAVISSLKQMKYLEDSLQMQEQHTQINKLKVQYEVDKLSYDNSQLLVARRQMQSVILAFILLAIFSLCGYLYYNLRRERKLQRELNVLRANAEESERQKTAFINHICHEIRTPLNAIAGFSQFIADNSSDEQQEFAALIADNKEQLTTLINHLLTVSRLDSSDEQLFDTPIDIVDICRREFDKANKQCKEGVIFRRVLPDAPLLIPGSEEYLSLVVENLLNNATKFTHKGEITLTLSATKASETIRIVITDTGCGIAQESHEKIFERFVKLDSFSSGNGLGLYLCRMIVTRLGGTIRVDPDYTEGTRMVVELPSE